MQTDTTPRVNNGSGNDHSRSFPLLFLNQETYSTSRKKLVTSARRAWWGLFWCPIDFATRYDGLDVTPFIHTKNENIWAFIALPRRALLSVFLPDRPSYTNFIYLHSTYDSISRIKVLMDQMGHFGVSPVFVSIGPTILTKLVQPQNGLFGPLAPFSWKRNHTHVYILLKNVYGRVDTYQIESKRLRNLIQCLEW